MNSKCREPDLTPPPFSFPKPYFHAILASYVVGLATTLYMMTRFEAAQPALLYLVPACLGSVVACGTLRGEMKDVWQFSEEEEEVELDENEKVKKA